MKYKPGDILKYKEEGYTDKLTILKFKESTEISINEFYYVKYFNDKNSVDNHYRFKNELEQNYDLDIVEMRKRKLNKLS
jgi:hypothetical protein